MAVICNTCGLPDDLCACGELAKDSTKIIIRLETRRFRKKGTMIEGLDPKLNNLETVARDLKNKFACGGTAKVDPKIIVTIPISLIVVSWLIDIFLAP